MIEAYGYATILFTGNVLSTVGYILSEGIDDPSWTALLGANAIGMFVSLMITLVLFVLGVYEKVNVGTIWNFMPPTASHDTSRADSGTPN